MTNMHHIVKTITVSTDIGTLTQTTDTCIHITQFGWLFFQTKLGEPSVPLK